MCEHHMKLMALLIPLSGQDDYNKMQHDFFSHVMFVGITLVASSTAPLHSLVKVNLNEMQITFFVI